MGNPKGFMKVDALAPNSEVFRKVHRDGLGHLHSSYNTAYFLILTTLSNPFISLCPFLKTTPTTRNLKMSLKKKQTISLFNFLAKI